MTDVTFTIADYPEIRRRGINLHSKIFRKLTSQDIKTCAKHLGVWQHKVLTLKNDTEVDLFTDYAIYGYQPHGFNLAEKFLRLFHKEADSFELALLQHLRSAHYTICQIEETNGTDRLKVIDLFSKEIYPLVDYQLAKSAYPGLMLAGYLVDFNGFAMMTGGAVQASQDILQTDEVAMIIDQIDDDQLTTFLNNPVNGAKLAKAILSATFRLGKTGNIQYRDL